MGSIGRRREGLWTHSVDGSTRQKHDSFRHVIRQARLQGHLGEAKLDTTMDEGSNAGQSSAYKREQPQCTPLRPLKLRVH